MGRCGVSMAYNPGVHIEILGHRTITQGKGGFAINRIEIAVNKQVRCVCTAFVGIVFALLLTVCICSVFDIKWIRWKYPE